MQGLRPRDQAEVPLRPRHPGLLRDPALTRGGRAATRAGRAATCAGRAAIVAAAIIATAGCGSQAASDAQRAPRSDRLVDFSKKPPFVNALDRDPASGELLLTTNRGVWRIDPERDTVERVRGTIAAGGR